MRGRGGRGEKRDRERESEKNQHVVVTVKEIIFVRSIHIIFHEIGSFFFIVLYARSKYQRTTHTHTHTHTHSHTAIGTMQNGRIAISLV